MQIKIKKRLREERNGKKERLLVGSSGDNNMVYKRARYQLVWKNISPKPTATFQVKFNFGPYHYPRAKLENYFLSKAMVKMIIRTEETTVGPDNEAVCARTVIQLQIFSARSLLLQHLELYINVDRITYPT
jgi:hypothetical protein